MESHVRSGSGWFPLALSSNLTSCKNGVDARGRDVVLGLAVRKMASRAKVRKCTTDDKRPLEGSECSSADESSVSEGWSDSEDSSRCSQTVRSMTFAH